VYMLPEEEIVEDWAAIKQYVMEKKVDGKRSRKHLNSIGSEHRQARFEEGKLFYEGQWFTIGSSVWIDKTGSSPLNATISAINTGEVWVRRRDGSKTKLYISALRKGKCTIRPDR